MPGPSLASLGLEVAVWSPRLGIQRIYRDPGPGFRRGREKATEQPGAALEQARAALHRELVVKPNILSTQFCKAPTQSLLSFLGGTVGGGGHGEPKLAPRERMGTSPAALLAVKGFPEKQQSLWEISGERGWQRDSTMFPWGLFSERLSRTWGLYPRGTTSNAAIPEQQYSAHTAPGKASISRLPSNTNKAGKRRVHNTASPLGLH